MMMSAQRPGGYIKRPKTQQNTGGQKKKQKPKTAAMPAETPPCIFINAQIKLVVKDLDELKMISGKSLHEAERRKQNSINKITLNIKCLKELVPAQKKNDVKLIIDMLNRELYFGLYRNSYQLTLKSRYSIERMQEKIKQLQY